MRRPLDLDRLRELALVARRPQGRSQLARLPSRYQFLAEVSGTGPGTVDLDRHGTTIPDVPVPAHYTPGVNDVLLCEYVGSQVVVYGQWA